MRPLSSFALIIVALFTACKMPAKNVYTISSNIDSSELRYEKFFTLEWQKREDSLEESLKPGPLTKDEKAYREALKNDVAIIYAYEHDSLIIKQSDTSEESTFTRALTRAIYENDTLKIAVAVGFFGFEGVLINIYGDKFNGEFFAGGDGDGFLKYNRADTNFVNDLHVSALSEKLSLNKKPLGGNKILIGEYEGTFKPFYERNVGEVTERKVKWKVIFKCVVRSVELRNKN